MSLPLARTEMRPSGGPTQQVTRGTDQPGDRQSTMLLRNANLERGRADILVRGNVVAAVTAPGFLTSSDHQVVDLEGRHVLPGLCDAHLHFWSWAAEAQ